MTEMKTEKLITLIETCLADAAERLGAIHGINPSELYLNAQSWTQTWDNSILGFWGAGFDVLTKAVTVVITNDELNQCVVYHGGRWAYTAPLYDYLKRGINDQRLPGQADWHRLMPV